MTDYSYIDRNLEAVRKNIAEAAEAAGRRAEDITLLAAVKYTEPGEITHLRDCGIKYVGENRVQQYREHVEVEGYGDFKVHFIGTLQTNKVKYIAGKIGTVESVDSQALALALNTQSEKAGVVTDVFCEINIGREENKSGILPDFAPGFCELLTQFPNLKLRGFMTMAPVCENPDDYRKYFRETYRIALDIWQKTLHNIGRPLLSMGMSDSYREAILEGADIVRVGRGLFRK